MARQLTFAQAINEALDLCLRHDPSVYVMGLGVPDPKGLFGTTLGLQAKHGPHRVLDVPTSENALTGIGIGSALVGLRPVLVHARLDFALLTVEQLVNQAAKWHYTFNGKASVPFVVRLIVGRGWGQGPQHSQLLHSWFAHIPGLKVVLPTTPHDAKGLLIASIEDNNPVIFIEHRWLHHVTGPVPEDLYRVPIGSARVAREGADITIAATSYMTLEAIRAADLLARLGVETEIVDLRTVNPLDEDTLLSSVRKTGRLIAADLGWKNCGLGSEIVARTTEALFHELKTAPRRISLPDCPTPTSPALAQHYYPRAIDIARLACEMLELDSNRLPSDASPSVPLDVPDPSFCGPF